jgi:hypothetical protein
MFQLYLVILALITFLSLKPDFMQNKVKSIGIKLIYNIIYFYSACQIKFNQAYNYFLPYFKSDEVIDKVTMEQFNIDTNDLLTISKDILDVTDTFDIQDKLDNKLFIVSKNIINDLGNNVSGDSNTSNTSNTSNNILITNKLIIDKNNICLSFDASNITFIALYLNYNGERYNINLKTDDFNYYLVGNKIDKRFIQYYINTVLSLKFSYAEPEIRTYELELMDHEVNIVYLSSEQSIIIDKDGYHIINNKEDESKEKENEKEKEKDVDDNMNKYEVDVANESEKTKVE